MQATKERCPAPCLTGLGGLSHGSVLHAGRCLQTLLRLQEGTQKPWPSRSHFLPQSSGRLLKPQALTLKIRHKLAAFFKAPKSAVPIYFSPSQRGAAGNRSAWKTPCCKLLVVSPGRCELGSFRELGSGTLLSLSDQAMGSAVQILNVQTGVRVRLRSTLPNSL